MDKTASTVQAAVVVDQMAPSEATLQAATAATA
jgi:hypothetical protein